MFPHINEYKEVNVNKQYEFIWIGPERVGSRTTAKIFTFCGFSCRGKQLSFGNALNYTHNSEIPEEFKDYKIICSGRNPYSRTLSLYKNFIYKHENMTFKEYVFGLTRGKPSDNFKDGDSKYRLFINPVLEKQPDYVVRLENFYEDIKKLPFIFNHLTEKQLEMLCDHGKEIDEWESHYDQEMKDLVYQHLKHHFDMWGYEK